MFKNILAHKKAALFILAVIIAIVVTVITYYPSQPPSSNPQPSPTTLPTVNTSPSDINIPKKNITITSTLSPEGISIPPTIPVYQLSPLDLSTSNINNLAKLFGFTTPSYQTTGVDGTVYFFSENGRQLRIVPDLSLVDYKHFSDTPSANLFPSDSQLINTAQNFLNSLNLAKNLVFKQINFINYDDEHFYTVNHNQATYAHIYFEQVIDKYPIINTSPKFGTISIMLNKDSQVVQIYLDSFSTFTPQSNINLKTFTQLEKSISSATIQSLDNGNLQSDSQEINQLTRIVVSSAHIAYLKDVSTPNLLQPIFVLNGTGYLSSNKTVPALLYLPAINQ